MTHPRPACSPNCLKRMCSLHVDFGLPAAKRQRNAQSKYLVRANRNTASEHKPERTRVPHAHDILCGRGGSVNRHPGNVIFRKVVEANKERYRNCLDSHKALLSKSIVLALRSQSPPGRFLTRSSEGAEWVEVGDAKALLKTSQALREGRTEEESRRDGRAESEPNRPLQEEMDNVVLQLAQNGFSNCRGTMKVPDGALSSQPIANEITNSPGKAVVTADLPVGADEITNSSEVESATNEESTSKFFRELSPVASKEMQLRGLAAAILEERLAPGDEASHNVTDDQSTLSSYSDADCLDELQFLYEDHVHDASFGLLPELRIDMDNWDDDLPDMIGE